MQAFQDWLRARLTELDWTNADLERATGVSNSIIWRWLASSPRRPTPANLKKIAGPLGVPYEDLMKLCNYLPGEPRAVVDQQRQAIRDQFDAWRIAVGPEYEEFFWRNLRTSGDSMVDLIQQFKTAVRMPDDAAVSDVVSTPKRRSNRRGGTSDGPLTDRYPTARRRFAELVHSTADALSALTRWPGASLGRPLAT